MTWNHFSFKPHNSTASCINDPSNGTMALKRIRIRSCRRNNGASMEAMHGLSTRAMAPYMEAQFCQSCLLSGEVQCRSPGVCTVAVFFAYSLHHCSRFVHCCNICCSLFPTKPSGDSLVKNGCNRITRRQRRHLKRFKLRKEWLS